MTTPSILRQGLLQFFSKQEAKRIMSRCVPGEWTLPSAIIARETDLEPLMVTAADGISAQVTLDGSGSTGDIVSYVWAIDEVEIATGVNPTVALDVGVHVITLTVTDSEEATDSDQVTITVEAPAVTCDTTITAGDVTGLKAAITSANGAGSAQTICLEV